MAMAPCSARALCMARTGLLCTRRGSPMSRSQARPLGSATGVPPLMARQPRPSRSLPPFQRFGQEGIHPSFCRAESSPGALPPADVAPADVAVDIAELAEKARLRLSPEEAAEFQSSVARIVGWFGQLQAADVAGVAPAVHATAVEGEPGLGSLRSDTPVSFAEREAMLGEVPSREGPYLKVPRILGAEPDA